MPEAYKDEKRKEFLNLKQGNMSIAEYEVQFNKISHYATFMVSTGRDKCRKFEEGLKYEIKNRITTTDLDNYARLRAAAIRAEKLMKEAGEQQVKRVSREFVGGSSREYGKKARYMPSQPGNGSGYSSSRGRGMTFSYPGRGQSQYVEQRPTCSHCGR